MRLNEIIKRIFLYGLIIAVSAGIAASIGAHSLRSSINTVQSGSSIELEQIVDGLRSPVYVTDAKDGSKRLFIVEQPGRIRIFQNGGLSASPFLAIESRVLAGAERGLLSMAFHPRYKENRRFFVNYTRAGDGATVIAEYKVSETDPNIADSQERVLLTIPQPFSNHNGGQLQFGPDGFLYIGMGDGGSGGDPMRNGQNNESLLGKMLRIDVDKGSPYSSPKDNPFFGSTPGRDEIYATGLRNPWRFSFDRFTGELYAADVGQNRLEEVDLVVKGGNYGWNVMEGSLCFNPSSNCNRTGLILPVAEYGRDFGCSITGGYVYRGKAFPDLTGTYLYGDFCSGIIFGYRGGSPDILLRSGLNISSFGEDEDGELYVVDLGGSVSRIKGRADSDRRPPQVNVLSPNGGENIKAGSTLSISWESSDNVGVTSHDVLLSTDGGATFPTAIATGLSGSDNSFLLSIPADQEKIKKARIKVVAVDFAGNRGEDASDSNFKIKPRKR